MLLFDVQSRHEIGFQIKWQWQTKIKHQNHLWNRFNYLFNHDTLCHRENAHQLCTFVFINQQCSEYILLSLTLHFGYEIILSYFHICSTFTVSWESDIKFHLVSDYCLESTSLGAIRCRCDSLKVYRPTIVNANYLPFPGQTPRRQWWSRHWVHAVIIPFKKGKEWEAYSIPWQAMI